MIIAPRLRLVLLALTLAAQSVMFVVLLPRPLVVEADNTRYETAGANLAAGLGLTIPFADLPDSDLRDWGCARTPQLCSGDRYPTASYAPGYQVFIALLYLVAGRSLWLLVGVHCVLLLLMVVLFEDLARRLLHREGYVFVMLIAMTYPFLARQAGRIMSDHLHATLFLGAVWALVALKPGMRRGVVVGLLLATATLTRPYSLVCFPVLLLPAVRRRVQIDMSELGVLSFAAALPFSIWIVRNGLVFGRFIPLTASGLGAALYLNKLELTIGSSIDGGNAAAIYSELSAVAGGDINTWSANRLLQQEALRWLVDHPGPVMASLVKRVPRVWISMGTQGAGLHPLAWLLVLYLGGLLVMGVAGMWRRRNDTGPWLAIALMVLAYWAFLMHTPAEARRTLPLRWPMLLFAGSLFNEGWNWMRRRRATVQGEAK